MSVNLVPSNRFVASVSGFLLDRGSNKCFGYTAAFTACVECSRFLTVLLCLCYHLSCLQDKRDWDAPPPTRWLGSKPGSSALILRLYFHASGCFRIQTGTERGTQWAERAPSRRTMSRKGKESSQEGSSVLCRKYQRGNEEETKHAPIVYVCVCVSVSVSL